MSYRRKKQSEKRKIPAVTLKDGRTVVSVYHEARGFTVAPRIACRRDAAEFPYGPILADGASADGDYLQIVLDHKNGFLGGVVVGSLTATEEAEWVGRTRGRLDIRCGQLVLPGYVVSVPPGKYVVDVYCYFPGQTAFRCANHWTKALAEDEWTRHPFRRREPLGSYFRRTRPGEGFPAWLEHVCREDANEDPEPPDAPQETPLRLTPRPSGGLQDSSDSEALVDLIVRLEPVEEFPRSPPPSGRLGLVWPWSCRQPDLCPRGITTAAFCKPA
jgi:hypothetical protein